jgi:hypothetical protein
MLGGALTGVVRSRKRLVAVAAAGFAAAFVAGAPGTATASHEALLFPAAAGTRWEVFAGYNTATHSAPNAWELDLVRTDAETAGTPVLAPISGRVSYTSSDCMTVRTDGISVLLCHLFVDRGIERGVDVSRGDRLGVVAPAHAAGNNGLPHIHMAVHDSSTSYFGLTLPLVGPYAIEGREFPATNAWNAYSGVKLVSTNGNSRSAPSLPVPPAPPTGPDAPTLSYVPVRGHSGLTIWSGGTITDLLGVAGGRGCSVRTFAVSSTQGTLVIYVAGAPSLVNSTFHSIFPGGTLPLSALFLRCA